MYDLPAFHNGILAGVVDVELGESDVCVLIVVIAVIAVVLPMLAIEMELFGNWKLN